MLTITFYECEHEGDLEPYEKDIVDCGGKVLSTQINEDTETAIIEVDVDNPASFIEKFQRTNSVGFSNLERQPDSVGGSPQRRYLAPHSMKDLKVLLNIYGLRTLVDAVGAAARENVEDGVVVLDEYGDVMKNDDVLTAVANLDGQLY
jgi:hypothetical protein